VQALAPLPRLVQLDAPRSPRHVETATLAHAPGHAWIHDAEVELTKTHVVPIALRCSPMRKHVTRAVVEVGFIVFLFYSNLLMGEYERSGPAESRGLAWALGDIFTARSVAIALFAGVAGYVVVEYLRRKQA
jgi:hypothetical protein